VAGRRHCGYAARALPGPVRCRESEDGIRKGGTEMGAPEQVEAKPEHNLSKRAEWSLTANVTGQG